MKKKAEQMAAVELQRLIQLEVEAQMPQLKAEVSKILEAARAEMLAAVEKTVQQERKEQLAVLRSIDVAAEKVAKEAATAAELARQTREREAQGKHATEQVAEVERRHAAEKQRQDEQARILNRGGAAARPKLKFGFGASNLL